MFKFDPVVVYFIDEKWKMFYDAFNETWKEGETCAGTEMKWSFLFLFRMVSTCYNVLQHVKSPDDITGACTIA